MAYGQWPATAPHGPARRTGSRTAPCRQPHVRPGPLSTSCSHCACVPSSNATYTRDHDRNNVTILSRWSAQLRSSPPCPTRPVRWPRSLTGERPDPQNESPVVSWQPLLPFVWSLAIPNLQEGARFQYAIGRRKHHHLKAEGYAAISLRESWPLITLTRPLGLHCARGALVAGGGSR